MFLNIESNIVSSLIQKSVFNNQCLCPLPVNCYSSALGDYFEISICFIGVDIVFINVCVYCLFYWSGDSVC